MNVQKAFSCIPMAILFWYSLLMVGCEKTNAVGQKKTFIYKLENPQDLLDQYNSPSSNKKGDYVKGELSIYQGDGQMIHFYIEPVDPNQLPIRYSLQFVQPSPLLENLYGKKIAQAEVLYLRRSIIINDELTDFRLLASIDEQSAALLTHFAPKNTLSGFGLIRMSSTNGEELLMADAKCKCCGDVYTVANDCPKLPKDCDAGGVGSDSCSYSAGGTSCSVDCSDSNRSYACCWGGLTPTDDDGE